MDSSQSAAGFFNKASPVQTSLFQLCTSQIQSGVTPRILILKHTHGPKEKCDIRREEGPVEGAASMTHVSQLDAMFLMSGSPSPSKPCICFSHTCLTSNQLLIDKRARGPFKKNKWANLQPPQDINSPYDQACQRAERRAQTHQYFMKPQNSCAQSDGIWAMSDGVAPLFHQPIERHRKLRETRARWRFLSCLCFISRQ